MAEIYDENLDWPTKGEYEYAEYYNDMEPVVTFDRMEDEVMTKSYDIAIIGAGPVGAAIAFKLSKDDPKRSILLIEKNWAEPDRFVGELMQPSGCDALGRLGLGNAFSGIDSVPVHGYYLSYKGEHCYIPYAVRPAEETRYKGVSFHHGRFVMNIRAACKSRPNITCLEASVTELIAEYRKEGMEEIMAKVNGIKVGPARSTGGKDASFSVVPKLTFVCDGITSQFRKIINPKPIHLISHFCAFVLEHDPIDSSEFFDGPEGKTQHVSLAKDSKVNPLPMPHNGHVFLDGSGPLLLYQLDECQTRVLADLPGSSLPSEASGKLTAALRESLSKAAPKETYPGLNRLLMATLDSTRRVRAVGNKFIPAVENRVEGAIWIGDSLNIRHPLTGGGMTVGFWDVVLFTNLFKEVDDITDVRAMQKLKAQWYWQRRPRALVVNTLSVALHDLFASDSLELDLLKEACFKYLRSGGSHTMDPSGFLSGLNPNIFMLIYHFFAVALLAVNLRISGQSKAYQGGNVLYRIYTAFYTLWVASCVILPYLWKELCP